MGGIINTKYWILMTILLPAYTVPDDQILMLNCLSFTSLQRWQTWHVTSFIQLFQKFCLSGYSMHSFSDAENVTFFRALKSLPVDLDPLPKDITQDLQLLSLSDVCRLSGEPCYNISHCVCVLPIAILKITVICLYGVHISCLFTLWAYLVIIVAFTCLLEEKQKEKEKMPLFLSCLLKFSKNLGVHWWHFFLELYSECGLVVLYDICQLDYKNLHCWIIAFASTLQHKQRCISYTPFGE